MPEKSKTDWITVRMLSIVDIIGYRKRSLWDKPVDAILRLISLFCSASPLFVDFCDC